MLLVAVEVGVEVVELVAVEEGVGESVLVELFVGVEVKVIVAVLVGVEVSVGVKVKVQVQGVPWLFMQEVGEAVKVLVGAGAVGLVLPGQPAMKRVATAKTDRILRTRNFITRLQDNQQSAIIPSPVHE